jgi:hypothetical protein
MSDERQMMNNAGPIFDPATTYCIEVRGRVDAEWLQSFDSSTEILVRESGQVHDSSVLHVYTDQSGMIGLLRRLHSLGMTIQQVRIVTGKEK